MSDLDQGQWLVTYADQRIATFFLPLPEPLGFKKGKVLGTYLPFSVAAVQLLEDAGVDVTYVSLDDLGAPAITGRQDRSPRKQSDRENWSNKVTLSTFVLVHQVEADPWARSGFDAVVVVAGAASGGVGTLRILFCQHTAVPWAALALPPR